MHDVNQEIGRLVGTDWRQLEAIAVLFDCCLSESPTPEGAWRRFEAVLAEDPQAGDFVSENPDLVAAVAARLYRRREIDAERRATAALEEMTDMLGRGETPSLDATARRHGFDDFSALLLRSLFRRRRNGRQKTRRQTGKTGSDSGV